MRVLTASDRALLVECADLDEALRMHRVWADVPGVIERVPGARTVLVRFDPLLTSALELAEALALDRADSAPVTSATEVTIPVHYDGEDLADVAAALGVAPAEVVRRHCAARWTVAFGGFAPGFGYLVGDDPLFEVPRRGSPRIRVPAGSVALAGPFTGIYPRESPGGWQLIGRTGAVMWDIERDPPALLPPGTSVRFTVAEPAGAAPVPRAETSPPLARGAARTRDAPRPVLAGPRVEVVHPGLQLLVQDRGRVGHAELGVPASGAVDRTALRDANRAVGNALSAAVLEGIGPTSLRFHGPGVIAVTGAEAELVILRADGRQHTAVHGAPLAIADGDMIDIGAARRGLRFVLAVRGGIRVPAQLGSRAADTLSGIGPAPLRPNDVVPIGDEVEAAVDPHPRPRHLPALGEVVELDITLGPRDDWFTPEAVRVLGTQEWLVTARSDRVGIRLRGENPLRRHVLHELPSEGVVAGAIQVPADGQPVLFLRDHPTTGGYPVIGALTDAALDLAGQLAPGVRLRFRVASGSPGQVGEARRGAP